jgi:hypothetical protein
MKWFPNIRFRRELMITAVSAVMIVVFAQEPMQDLRIPLEHYDSGSLKTELFASRAEVPTNGNIVASGIVLKTFSEAGDLEMQIDADDCVYDQSAQVASSSNHVSLKRGEITVSGDGFKWVGAEETLTVLRNARLAFPSAIVGKERGEVSVQN